MQITVLGRVLEAEVLDVVRLVASARGILDVDVERFPEKVTIKYDGKTITGRTMDLASAAFFKAVLT